MGMFVLLVDRERTSCLGGFSCLSRTRSRFVHFFYTFPTVVSIFLIIRYLGYACELHSQIAFFFILLYLPYCNATIIWKLSCTHTNLGYIGEFEIVDDHRANKIVLKLTGRLNKCGVISPRFDVSFDELEKWVVNLLPSRQFGHILISTTYGIMTHEEARRKKTGGKILGFFY